MCEMCDIKIYKYVAMVDIEFDDEEENIKIKKYEEYDIHFYDTIDGAGEFDSCLDAFLQKKILQLKDHYYKTMPVDIEFINKNFISLAEWREEQINSILED
jgi:hypothetical protein